jgi:hypothetical protein
MTAAFFIYGFWADWLVISLGGLFAWISPSGPRVRRWGYQRVLVPGRRSRIDQRSPDRGGVTIVDGVRHYDFGPVITFWVARRSRRYPGSHPLAVRL